MTSVPRPGIILDFDLHCANSRDLPNARSEVVTAVKALIMDAINAIFSHMFFFLSFEAA